MAPSMFQRLGGFAKVRKIVSELYDRLLDSELERYFHGVDVRRLIDHQTKFIASIMGGPASFSDEHLQRAHEHLGISHADFRLMAELLSETLADFGLDPAEIQFVMQEVALRQQSVVVPPTTVEA
jgi:hemoglobin